MRARALPRLPLGVPVFAPWGVSRRRKARGKVGGENRPARVPGVPVFASCRGVVQSPRATGGPRGLLARLSADERADYAVLRRYKFSRAEALHSIGRGDLAGVDLAGDGHGHR